MLVSWTVRIYLLISYNFCTKYLVNTSAVTRLYDSLMRPTRYPENTSSILVHTPK